MIRVIENKTDWDVFLLALEPNTFLQSWAWGETQKKVGEGVLRLGVFDGEQQVAAALILIVNARRGRHYLIPHGPIVSDEKKYQECLKEIVSWLKKRATQDKVVALRVAPLIIDTKQSREIFQSFGFRFAPIHVHTELTWVLNIKPASDELLRGMRKTTRQAITKALNSSLTAEVVRDVSAVERFLPLYQETRQRHGFVPFDKKYLGAELGAFLAGQQAFSVFAQLDGRDVAAGIFIKFGPTVFYHHGASIKVPGNLPAAHLVQWAAIQEAKKLGAKQFNFWGIAPDNAPKHPFAGITVFKKGFGGEALNYLHAQDLPLSPGYFKLWVVDTIRRYKRGF